jgi:hypothetical protein
MKKFTSALFLALVLAITVTSTSAQTGGQIPIGGRTAFEPNKTTTAVIAATIEPKNEFSSGISDYLWTFAGIIRQFKF